VEELVDRYQLRCRPVRDLLVDYLRERQASLDFASLEAISSSLAGLFWAKVEALAPGIDSLRLPVLPVLVRAANDRRLAAAARLQAAQQAQPGALLPNTNGTLRRAVAPTATGRHVWAEEMATGKRRNLTYEEDEAFWAFATIEVLRLTGIRAEELLELSHHSIIQYRLPSTGEVVPLLQVAPSKTDTERLLLVSPELADVLSAIVSRLRGPNGAIPLVASYDVREKVWNPPMPLLFQRAIGTEHRAFTPSAIRKLLINALAATGLTDANGDPLVFSPHDFRRIFVTDAIMSGLPPHIAQVICGHKTIDTTMGYKAVYPAETIEAHRAFIARRRRPAPARNTERPPTTSGMRSSPTLLTAPRQDR
jgi:integrase